MEMKIKKIGAALVKSTSNSVFAELLKSPEISVMIILQTICAAYNPMTPPTIQTILRSGFVFHRVRFYFLSVFYKALE